MNELLDKILELLPIAGATDREEQIRELILASEIDVNKIKAEAVREALNHTSVSDDFGDFSCSVYALEDYADKLERGES